MRPTSFQTAPPRYNFKHLKRCIEPDVMSTSTRFYELWPNVVRLWNRGVLGSFNLVLALEYYYKLLHL